MFDTITSVLVAVYTLVLGWALTIGRGYIERRFFARFDARFAKRLEEHKHRLQLSAENARHEYRKSIAEFNLFSERKHAALGEIYEALRIAHGAVLGLQGVRYEPTYEEFSAGDLRRRMEEKGVPEGKRDEVLSLWATNRDRAIRDVLQPYLRLLEMHAARRAANEAQNLVLAKEVYLPEAILETCNELLKLLRVHLVGIENPPTREQAHRRLEEENARQARIEEALKNLRKLIHVELSGRT